ncbi:DNA methylase [Streptomyces sp. PRh5]|uniref:BREX-2 system adenine-specific DNA-methyltransferase PglX n=1 Tax=Streptomyces sp. PRh5 TaxID=1158056 RepID=UPI00044DE6D6|nr:BREX-2 system adenine-specific DNA-methyltransferase PglX [Streptomyces sp. PRh5]EXU68041.1 DNA methylase [Streptomyces sp. PRh5]
MIDAAALRTDLIKQVKTIEVDLAKQVKDGESILKPLRQEYEKASKADPASPRWSAWLDARLGSAEGELSADRVERVRAADSVAGKLRAEYDEARKLGRTAATWNAWLDERVTQVAVAWVLGTVFVRFCEDNRLIAEPYLTGPDAERRDLAEARYAQYVEEDPDPTYRGWLERAFEELGAGQAGKLLFDKRRNPLYQIPLSHDAARALVEFWRERGEGEDADRLVHDFTDPLDEDDPTKGWDTRFLGDLYQWLSESARKTYALLQTPEFVEEFILDRTMDPVVRELGGKFGELKMIDPTCGSGHFVLGAFRRMVRLFAEREPGRDVHERVRDALNAVHGVDINPFAVAIARFRLLVAGMAAAGVRTLTQAGRYDWPIHLAVGDSLIKARQLELTLLGEESGDPLAEFSYATEDVHAYPGILEVGRYDVVVGNPPYITVKDKKLNDLYRGLYASCTGTYALSVPFAERFFQLAKVGNPDGHGYGMVGQITANSFMKREFGAKLIEEYFAHKAELTEVIDTSGAYIPGHGTPTVILVGRRRSGSGRTTTVRTVRSVQSEPGVPRHAQDGLVWNAIVNQIDEPGSADQWVSVDDLARDRYFSRQPWILADGGLELVEQLDKASISPMTAAIDPPIGRAIRAGADEAYIRPLRLTYRAAADPSALRPLLIGEIVRDWGAKPVEAILYPYTEELRPGNLETELWPLRRLLEARRTFQGDMADAGLNWWDYMQHTASAYKTPLSINFAEVATHNHFVLNRGGNVFKQTAPAIKLPTEAREEEHYRLLSVLNSSTACFWLKMMCHNKGRPGAEQAGADEPWEHRYQFNGTNVADFPLAKELPSELAAQLDGLATRLQSVTHLPTGSSAPTAASLRKAKQEWTHARARMIGLQEELDWTIYAKYNLLTENIVAPQEEIPDISPAERAFAIVLARKVERGESATSWFVHHNHNQTPVTEIPDHWPDSYKSVVKRRIEIIETSRALGMIERPEFKRRWATEGWDVLQERALKSWLLDRMENRELWFPDGQPTILTLDQLTSALSLDEDFVSVAELYAPRTELAAVLADLLAEEHVPFLPALRYKPSGLKKREDWEHVWDLQRKEDAAPDEPAKRKIRDTIPVPPKYTSADFVKPSYWRARGKLDVPKERFISYATGAISGTPKLFGWAGWDHREQAQALATYFTNHDGLSSEEMTPLLAGLLELQPWLDQWHNAFDPLYGSSPAAFFAGYRATQQGEHDLTDDDLRAWRPAPATRGRRSAKG